MKKIKKIKRIKGFFFFLQNNLKYFYTVFFFLDNFFFLFYFLFFSFIFFLDLFLFFFFFLDLFLFFFFSLRFFLFLSFFVYMSTYQFLIVRVTRSTLAGGRLPSVKIRVPLPFPLRATWSSCYYRFGSKGIHRTGFFFRNTRRTGSHFTHISTILLSPMSIKNDRLET